MKIRLPILFSTVAALSFGLVTNASIAAQDKPMNMPMPSPTTAPKPSPSPLPTKMPLDMEMPTPKPTVTPVPKAKEMEMPMPQQTPKPSPTPPNNSSTLGGEAQTTRTNLSPEKDFGEPVADNEIYSFLLLDLLEYESNGGPGSLRWDLVGWRGTDYNRFWFKSEGRQSFGSKTGEIEVQALYGRLIAPYFDFQVGMRVDNRWRRGRNASRFLAVVGLQGLARYRFEIEPALFISHKGDVSSRLTATKDFLLTQKAVLQGRFETNVAFQKVEKFGIGSGLNDVGLGLRLRYEIRREFAPYIGVSWRRSFGQTAAFDRLDGEATNRLSIVGGMRIWF